MVRLPLPERRSVRIQLADGCRVQVVLEVMDILKVSAAWPADRVVGVARTKGRAPFWVTLIVRLTWSEPMTVTVALREVKAVFSWQLTCRVAELVPWDGVTLSQESEVLAVQLTKALRATLEVPPWLLKMREEGLTEIVFTFGDCTTVTPCEATPFAVRLIVPERELRARFSRTVTWICPLLEPEAGETLSQSRFSAMVQAVLEDTLNVRVPAPDSNCSEEGLALRKGWAAFWVTVTRVDGSPDALTVMFAERGLAKALAETVTFTVPLFEPEAGEILSQVEDSLTVQDVLEVMEKLRVPPVSLAVRDCGETLKTGATALWVTDTVLEATPVPDTVIVALRSVVKGLGVAVTAMLALPEPEGVLTLSQSAASVTAQLTPDEVMANDELPPAEGNDRELGLTLKLLAPTTVTVMGLVWVSLPAKI